MTTNEELKDRLKQIETLVQRRVDQLPAGDAELRLCRAVRGLCVGTGQRVQASRRWGTLAGSQAAELGAPTWDDEFILDEPASEFGLPQSD